MGDHGHLGSYYTVLGVSRDASLVDIRIAYRRLAMKWHPDRWQRQPWLLEEANRKFQDIHQAYQVLTDGGKRSSYDAGLYESFEDDRDEGDVEVEFKFEEFDDLAEEMYQLMGNVKRDVLGCLEDELLDSIQAFFQYINPNFVREFL